MQKIKIGQIGIGHNHSDKIKAIHRHPERFELVGYAEEQEEWIARRGQYAHFADLPRLSVEEIIEKSDAILVETDVWDLTATAQRCVDAGKHIHMDKPASGTLEEYRHLLDTAKEKKLVVQLGYMYRYNPNIQTVISMVKSGKLGDIHTIDAEMSILHTDRYRRWLQNFKGGNFYIFGCHLLDLILYILGTPQKVLSHLGSSNARGVAATDISTVMLAYDHAIARVQTSSVECGGFERRRFSVAGTGGTLELRPIEGEAPELMYSELLEEDGRLNCSTRALPVEVLPMSHRYDEMLLAFHRYVTGAEENPFSYDHEYALQQLVDEIVGGVRYLGAGPEV